MPTYEIKINLPFVYEIKAETEEDAINKAYELTEHDLFNMIQNGDYLDYVTEKVKILK